MKNNLILLGVLLFSLSCNLSNQLKTLNIGDRFIPKVVKNDEPQFMVCGSGCFLRAYELKIKGINYSIGVDSEMNIKFISTEDDKFETKEKIKIGMTLKEVSEKIQKEAILNIGYAWYIPLSSGWNAAFKLSDYNSRTPIDPSTKVTFFFKD